jgi:hypothetical protein
MKYLPLSNQVNIPTYIEFIKSIIKLYKYILYYLYLLLIQILKLLLNIFKFLIPFLCKQINIDAFNYKKSLNSELSNKKIVFFFSLRPHTRERVFAKYAKANNYDVVMFSIGEIQYYDKCLYDKHFLIKNIALMQVLSWYYKDQIQHFFGLNGAVLYSFTMLKLNPIIADIYDTCEGIKDSSYFDKKLEYSVIENVDIISHRDLRIKNLYKEIDRNDKNDIYIEDIPVETIAKSTNFNQSSSDIHVVSTGWIDGKGNNILKTAEVLCNNDIHLHVMFNPLQNFVSEWSLKYSELEKKSKYFHIESPVFGEEYFDKISKYDFGISVYDENFVEENLWSYSKGYLASCGSSRVNDYISVGLGIIISPLFKYQIQMIEASLGNMVLADENFYSSPKRMLEELKKKPKLNIHRSNLNQIRSLQEIKIRKLYDSLNKRLSN